MKLKLSIAIMMMGVSFLFAPGVSAANVFNNNCSGAAASSKLCTETKKGEGETTKLIGTITNTMLYLLGAICVIMIIYAGFRYVTSNGDAGNVKAAKDIIMYAVIGLIAALLAWGIVQFVLSRF